MTYFLQQIINTGVVSGFYGLLAVSYVLMHGITGKVNLAFGALAVWAGSLTITFALTLMLAMPGKTLIPVALALLVALLSTALLGAVIERVVIRPLVHAGTLAMLVATLGLAIALEELMRLMNNSREIWLMPVLNEAIILADVDGFTLQVSRIQLIVVLTSVLLSLALIWFIERHPFGRLWRAVAQDARMAELCGIDTGQALAITFLVASGLTAAAGAMLAVYYGSVSFYSGLIIGLKTLFVAVVGGLSSIAGAFCGALLLGLLETFWSAYVGADYRDVASFSALTALMIFFPSGLFPANAVARGP